MLNDSALVQRVFAVMYMVVSAAAQAVLNAQWYCTCSVQFCSNAIASATQRAAKAIITWAVITTRTMNNSTVLAYLKGLLNCLNLLCCTQHGYLCVCNSETFL